VGRRRGAAAHGRAPDAATAAGTTLLGWLDAGSMLRLLPPLRDVGRRPTLRLDGGIARLKDGRRGSRAVGLDASPGLPPSERPSDCDRERSDAAARPHAC